MSTEAMAAKAARDRSRQRPSMNGPRSLIRTVTDLPLRRVRHPDPGVEGQGPVGGGQRVGVEGLAVGGDLALVVEGRAAGATVDHPLVGAAFFAGGRFFLVAAGFGGGGAGLAPRGGLLRLASAGGGRGRGWRSATGWGSAAAGRALPGRSPGCSATVGAGGADSPEASWTAPTVPPTASATPTAAVAAMPVGEENMRVRECLPATGRSFRRRQTGSDRNERSPSEVNLIMWYG